MSQSPAELRRNYDRAVLLESEAAAEDGAEAVVVEYESLDAVLDVERAMETDAPLARRRDEDSAGSDLGSMHTAVGGGEEPVDEETYSGNVLDQVRRRSGDVAAALEASDVVVSATFRTPWVYQAYLEPQVCTAWLEPGGTLVVSTSTQGSLVTRREARLISAALWRSESSPTALLARFGAASTIALPRSASSGPPITTTGRSSSFASSG